MSGFIEKRLLRKSAERWDDLRFLMPGELNVFDGRGARGASEALLSS